MSVLFYKIDHWHNRLFGQGLYVVIGLFGILLVKRIIGIWTIVFSILLFRICQFRIWVTQFKSGLPLPVIWIALDFRKLSVDNVVSVELVQGLIKTWGVIFKANLMHDYRMFDVRKFWILKFESILEIITVIRFKFLVCCLN